MDRVIETRRLAKRFGRTWALRDCDLAVPRGKVVGLVGPNGAGKTTLLHIAVGLLAPSGGTITVLGESPWQSAAQLLERVGFVAQERPLFRDFTVAEMLEVGRRLSPRWDHDYARSRLARSGVALDRRIRELSTGQRAQVALSLALGKRPELLLLDEPVANLDPVARLELLEELMSAVADDGPTVMLSSNALADVDRVCEHIVILVDGRVRLAGEIDEITRSHALVVGPRLADATALDPNVVEIRHADRQTARLLRASPTSRPAADDGTVVREPTLEEVVLAYLRSARTEASR